MIRGKDLPIEIRRKLGMERKPKGIRQPNGWEKQFADEVLSPLILSGDLICFLYERLNLPLSGVISYKPDFVAFGLTRPTSGTFTRPLCSVSANTYELNSQTFGGSWPYMVHVWCYEIKGRRRDSGMARFKLARAQYPWIGFKMFTRIDGRFREIKV